MQRSVTTFKNPLGLAYGNQKLYVADTGNNVIRSIDQSGKVVIVCGSGQTGNFDGDASSSSFNRPESIAFDSNGYLVVADSGNNALRNISIVSGSVATLEMSLSLQAPSAVIFDRNGNLYVSDTGNNVIQKLLLNPFVVFSVEPSSNSLLSGMAFNPITAYAQDSTGTVVANIDITIALFSDSSCSQLNTLATFSGNVVKTNSAGLAIFSFFRILTSGIYFLEVNMFEKFLFGCKRQYCS